MAVLITSITSTACKGPTLGIVLVAEIPLVNILPCLGDCDGRVTPSLVQVSSSVAGFADTDTTFHIS